MIKVLYHEAYGNGKEKLYSSSVKLGNSHKVSIQLSIQDMSSDAGVYRFPMGERRVQGIVARSEVTASNCNIAVEVANRPGVYFLCSRENFLATLLGPMLSFEPHVRRSGPRKEGFGYECILYCTVL